MISAVEGKDLQAVSCESWRKDLAFRSDAACLVLIFVVSCNLFAVVVAADLCSSFVLDEQDVDVFA